MRTRLITAGTVLAGAVALGVVAAQPAQSTIPAGKRAGTVTFTDISGSTDLKIQTRSFSWGVSQPGGHTGGGGQGKADFSPLNLSSESSAAAPMLWRAAAQGIHIKEAILTVTQPDSDTIAFKYKLTDVMITGLHEVLNGDDTATIQISLDYAKMKQDAYNAAGTAIVRSFCYDLGSEAGC